MVFKSRYILFFFFSSRRRHTRYWRDWSSDVCSSDLIGALATGIEQPSAARGQVGSCTAYSGLPADQGETASMAFIVGGVFTMGSGRHRPEERFPHTVRVDGFWIDRHEVTNAQFRQFVDATGYITLAERGLDPKTHPNLPAELLAPGSTTFVAPTDRQGGRVTQWFQYIV